MQYKISTEELVAIEPGDRIVLIAEFSKSELAGELLVVQTLDTILIVQIVDGKNVSISPEAIKRVKASNKITRPEIRPLVEDVLQNVLVSETDRFVKEKIEELVTQKFFDAIAKDAIKALVKNELGKALRDAANLIDPPKVVK